MFYSAQRSSILRSLSISTLTLLSSFSQAAITTGDLVITEIMANPAAVSDTLGEWFEIYNTTAVAIDLNGLLLRDEGSNSHTVANTDPTTIAAGDYFVFGRNDDSNNNGGYQVDYSYSNFTLGNSSDAIILELDGVTIDSLIYSGSIFGNAGNSAELLSNGFALTTDNYIYGDGDIGTPGSAGSFVPPSQVPVPAAGLMMATALSGLMLTRRKR